MRGLIKNTILFILALTVNVGIAQQMLTVPQGKYEIITQTLLPHLEENMYNTINQRHRCLSQFSIRSLFPVLEHPSFSNCNLRSNKKNSEIYDLVCVNSESATGLARIVVESDKLWANLEIKMGAKNMTFTQRTQAVKIGDCKVI